jgi:acyl carrier protein
MSLQPTNDIREQIIKGLRELLSQPADIHGDTSIVRDLGLDSVAVMDFILLIEDRFDISVPLDKVAEIVTVNDLVSTVEILVGKEQA